MLEAIPFAQKMLSFHRIGRDHHYHINIVSAINPSYFISILLRFEAFGRGEGTSSEWALELDIASIEEAWLRTAAPQARSSLPCGSNHRPAPLMLYSRANSARLEDKPTASFCRKAEKLH
ncbi:hypothetical protein [Alkalicoccus urumqiensis]|uniref:Uncharacterized protein n=1 Tax=Alkalicoccus urumqiensis TaxID=1548213 RepID=A0A2P6MKU8_ALKUR|nr:hypothetical protein [Alkalicoccus urumqiensis]PRO66891.1 hypothetical protein C6I21_02930 [Alkalicoccus urumqiensis]